MEVFENKAEGLIISTKVEEDAKQFASIEKDLLGSREYKRPE